MAGGEEWAYDSHNSHGEEHEVRMGPWKVLAPVVALAAALTSCASSTSPVNSPRSSTTIASASRSLPVDPSRLVLSADDFPTGSEDEHGRADLYDEPPPGFRAILDAAGLSPGSGAFTRSFHILGIRYGSITSFAVAVKTRARAAALFREGAPGLLVFNGFPGGMPNGTSINTPAGLGTNAVGYSAPGLNGGTTLAVVWLRNTAVGLLIIDRSDGNPRPELETLSKRMDDRMTAIA